MKMKKIFIVKLTTDERKYLEKFIKTGKSHARKLTRARILLKADISEGNGWIDREIASALDVGLATVERTRRDFVEKSLEEALNGSKRPPRNPVKVDGKVEAHLIALACSSPPEGHSYWTLKLLANGLVQAEVIDSISHEKVRQVLKKMNLSLGYESNGVSQRKKTVNL
jgi:transposase